MATPIARRSLGQLLKQGYEEIPEIYGATAMGLIGLGLGGIGCYNYMKNDGDNRRYKQVYVIMRPDDPKAKRIIRE